MRFGPHNSQQVAVLHESRLAAADGDDAVVHDLQQQRMKVDEIAGYVDGGYLAFSVFHELLARRKTTQDEAALGRSGALCNERFPGSERSNASGQFSEQPALLSAQLIAHLKRPDQL